MNAITTAPVASIGADHNNQCGACLQPDIKRLTSLVQQFDRSKDSKDFLELTKSVATLTASIDKHAIVTACGAPRCDLDALLFLIRGRYSNESTLSPSVRKLIITETNRLYKEGLGIKLMCLIQTGLINLKDTCAKDKSFIVAGSNLDTNLRKAAELLFFMYYGTQIEDNEVRSLVELLRSISEQLVDTMSPEVVDDWKTCAYAVLAILQMTHVASLDQFNSLLLRTVDVSQPSGGDGEGNGDGDVNRVKQAIGCDIAWRAKGAKGLACLACAVLRQPAVDSGEAPPAEVIKLLIEASKLRAYSYIRLCLLPVLQSDHLHDKDHFYIATICELMRKIAHIFVIYEEAQHPDRGQYLREPGDLAKARSGHTADGSPLIRADCVDDVMHCFATLFHVRPAFAESFVTTEEATDADTTFGSPSAAAAHAVVAKLHPFVVSSVTLCDRQPCLLLPAMRLLAAVAGGLFGCTALASHQFLRGAGYGAASGASPAARRMGLGMHHHHAVAQSRLSWEHFFTSIAAICARLNPSAAAAMVSAAGRAPLASVLSVGAAAGAVAVRAEPLGAKDEEGLLAIIDLIAVSAEDPAVAASLVAKYEPVKQLFALLACPVPVAVKGAIFKALAAFARSSESSSGVVEEIWSSVEDYRLLPAKAAAAFGSVDGGVVTASGVRFELESTESRQGVYPCTEGFLTLLDALLSAAPYVGNGWCVDALGTGYRRPGLMPYLEFVIDDVLLRAHERFYLPTAAGGGAGTDLAGGQRWRLTARALRVMVAIVQNYSVNRLPPPSGGAAVPGGDGVLEQVAADFREEKAEYAIEGQPAPVRCTRQKTVGFALMAMLLGRSRLLERVLSLLGECSLPALDQSKRSQGVETARVAVEVFGTMQAPFKPPLTAEEGARQGGGLNMFGAQMYPSSFGDSGQLDVDLEIDLSLMGFGDPTSAALCDASYWRERVVANCMGLLYECALRETRFLEHLRAAPPLTIIRCEDGRPAHIPVMVQGVGGMGEVLSTSLALGTIAHFLCLPPSKWHSLPPVPVLSARLLEHVACQQTPEAFLWALRSSADEDAFLMEGCVRAIVDGDEAETGAAVLKQVVPLGANALPDVYTMSASAAADRVASGGGALATRIKQQVLAACNGGDAAYTTRAAVLRLLLRTLLLNPDRPGLAHQLLGLRGAMEEAHVARAMACQKGALSFNISPLSLPSPGDSLAPSNCLQAILQLIMPSALGPDCSVIISHPELASTCFELLHCLCATPASSAVTLAYLRRRSVQFLSIQVHEALCLSSITDRQLEALLAHRDSAPSTRDAQYSAVEEVKAARHNCAAWLLRIFTLELRAQELSPGYSAGKMKELLDWLFVPGAAARAAASGGSGDSGGGGYEEQGGVPLMTLLKMALDLPPVDLPAISSPLVLRCLTLATVPYTVSRAVPSATLGSSGFTTIDLALFARLVQDECAALSSAGAGAGAGTGLAAALASGGRDMMASGLGVEFEAGVRAALSMNVYSKRAAAATHLCQAWGQLLDVTVLGCGGVLTGSHDRTGATAVRRLVVTVALPTLQALTTSNFLQPAQSQPHYRIGGSGVQTAATALETVMAEQLVRPLLSIVNALRVANAAAAPHAILTADEHQALLLGLCRSVLRPVTGGAASSSGSGSGLAAAGESPRVASSTFYRGMVYACLTRTLYLSLLDPTEASLAEPDRRQGRRQYSDELKDGGMDTASASAPGVATAAECRARDVVVLEQCAGELADLLGADASTGPAVWRVAALAALTAVLTSLSPSRHPEALGTGSFGSESFASHGYAQALKSLTLRGHLGAVLEYVGPVNRPSTAADVGAEEELFTSAVSLCVALGSTKEGATALLEGRFLLRLCALPFFRHPPPSAEEILPFGPDGSAMREEACAVLVARLTPVLRALRCLCSTFPSADVLAGTAAFLQANQRTVTYLLRLRLQTLRGLELTEGLLALFVAVAASPAAREGLVLGVVAKQARLSLLHANASTPAFAAAGGPFLRQDQASALPLWDTVLGPSGIGDGFTADVCALLRLLGAEPLPAPLLATLTGAGGGRLRLGLGGLGARATEASKSSWWARFAPAGEEEERWHAMPLAGTTGGGWESTAGSSAALANWSVFDQKKAAAALRMLSFCGAFLRLRAAACAAQGKASAVGGAGLLAIDFDAVSVAFLNASEVAHAAGRSGLSGPEAPTGWLPPATASLMPPPERPDGAKGAVIQALLPAMRLTGENLICVLHDMHVASTPEERACWVGGLDKCLTMCERAYPASSFVGQVGRWLRDHVENTQTF